VNAAFMSYQQHEGGIHAVWLGAGEVSVTEVCFPARTAADGEASLSYPHSRTRTRPGITGHSNVLG
jgi:hypothetical protein